MNCTHDLSPIDIVTYVTEELQQNYKKSSSPKEKAKLFDDFFDRWANSKHDISIARLKSIKFDFAADLDWFNVSQALSLRQLHGKIVLLDFFTYCCINCIHVLPDLYALENRFPIEKGLVIVGVHSPKFENERMATNILSAVQRYGITHPIVNDSHSELWHALGIRCWPSILLLSPNGVPMLLLMGEGHGSFLQEFIEAALSFFGRHKNIENFSLPLKLSEDMQPASNLRFPAKIARSQLGHRYAIADAGNNRVLVVLNNGVVEYKIGGFESGFIDGDFATSRFNNPQGITFLDEDTLIVADTKNHALRQISLRAGFVETLVGTGHQCSERTGGRTGPLQSISSPWDVAIFRTRDMDMSFHLDERNVLEKTIILISMAGTHQIWGYFPEGIIWWKFRKFEPRCCVSLIGNGLEENRNNSYPQNAAFAQPSGIAMAEDFLFIADSESSSIRKASMLDGKVMPVVGGDRNPLNLFAFGDLDGKLFNAKLQHPLGVAYNHVNDKVYVADTYNHKIKVIDPDTNTISTLSIRNSEGNPISFKEPASICLSADGNQLLVADTNNHTIVNVDLKTLSSQPFLLDFSRVTTSNQTEIKNQSMLLKTLPFYQKSTINFIIKLSSNLKYATESPQKWLLTSLNKGVKVNSTSGCLDKGYVELQVELVDNILIDNNNPIFVIQFLLNLCDTMYCLMKRFSIVINQERTKTAEKTPQFRHDININIDRSKISL
ncbi:NHL repeat-containing protein 2 [Drosophila tropicalis]|uniref:NHL repeat-containing protein 2 n=1 Tax=Drosophila tropicalis TaxID=46794 RepID=UPI0035AB72CC